MASGTTGEFYCGTYIRGRIRWTTTATSSGHNVTIRMDVYRTNEYTGDPISYNYQTDKLWIDGEAVGSWYNTTISNQTTWHELFSASKTVSHTAEKKISIGWSTDDTNSWYNGQWFGEITLEAVGSKPSGLSVTTGDKTWNSVRVSGSLTDWGVGSGPYVVTLATYNSAATKYTDSRKAISISTQNNVFSWPNRGPMTGTLAPNLPAIGCTPYKVGMSASNGFGTTGILNSTIFYTPPATPAVLEVTSDIPGDDNMTTVSLVAYDSVSDNVSGVSVVTRVTISGDAVPDGTQTVYTSPSHVAGSDMTIGGIELYQDKTLNVAAQTIFYYGDNNQYYVTSEAKVMPVYTTKHKIAPMAGLSWSDDRTVLSVKMRAGSDSVTRIKALWGYDEDVEYTLWEGDTGDDPVTSDWSHTSTIEYPNHGDGQFIYVQIYTKSGSGEWEAGDTVATPVENPILGICVDEDGNKEYIVDIVERKTDGTVTPKWKNGARIIKK